MSCECGDSFLGIVPSAGGPRKTGDANSELLVGWQLAFLSDSVARLATTEIRLPFNRLALIGCYGFDAVSASVVATRPQVTGFGQYV